MDLVHEALINHLEKEVSKLKKENQVLRDETGALASMVRVCLEKLNIEQTDFIVDYGKTSEYWDYRLVQEEM